MDIGSWHYYYKKYECSYLTEKSKEMKFQRLFNTVNAIIPKSVFYPLGTVPFFQITSLLLVSFCYGSSHDCLWMTPHLRIPEVQKLWQLPHLLTALPVPYSCTSHCNAVELGDQGGVVKGPHLSTTLILQRGIVPRATAVPLHLPKTMIHIGDIAAANVRPFALCCPFTERILQAKSDTKFD